MARLEVRRFQDLSKDWSRAPTHSMLHSAGPHSRANPVEEGSHVRALRLPVLALLRESALGARLQGDSLRTAASPAGLSHANHQKARTAHLCTDSQSPRR